MKKYLIPALALGLVMTSCQSDEPFAPIEGGEKQVTFTLNVPGELGTRAASGESGAQNNQNADIYYTLVLDANGDKQVLQETTKEKTVTFTTPVVLGRKYDITAYASYTNNIDATASNIKAIAVEKSFNDETKDAYTSHVEDHDFALSALPTMQLKRPFGKLRLIATDYVETGTAKNTAIDQVTITYNNTTATTYDATTTLFNNVGTGITATKDFVKYYDAESDGMPIFADYLPANREDNPITFTVTVRYAGSTETYSRTFNDIPVRRNALTTLKGAFFTANSEIKVEIKDAFEGQPENINFVSVSNASQLQDAINKGGNGETIILTGDINLNDLIGPNPAPTRSASDAKTLEIKKGTNRIIDLNGYTLSATTAKTGNCDMMLIKGDLTVKNGTITYQYTGENQGWNAMTTIFDVTDGGVLNLEGVTAKNLGGSDMGFVAHLNNWGEVSLNVENSTLESNYVAVRVFNSGYDMNNVTIKNSTLKGGNYAFWVHNYTKEDFSGDQGKANAQKALLNFDIFNGTNTFVGKNETPIRLGMTNAVYLNANVSTVAGLQPLLAQGLNLTLSNNLTITPEEMLTAPYGNKMALSHNGGVFNGNGKNISVTANGDNYVVMTNGGNIKNLDIDRGFRGIVLMYPNQDVYVDNVNIGVDDEVCYTINTAEGDGKHDLFVSNSNLYGWCSIGTAVKSVTFTNCKFGQGTYYTNVHGRLVKPYVDAVFEGCEFCSMAYLDLSAFVGTKVTLKNCTVNGVKLTAENWTSLVAPEATCGEGQISVELKNGTYLTADNVADYIIIE